MELRKKLTILFLALIASIIITSSFVVYFWFAEYRKSEFYDRLSKKAQSFAELLIDVEEVDTKLLKRIEKTKTASFVDENILIYNYKNEIIYSNASNWFYLSKEQLDKIRVEGKIEYATNDMETLGLYYKGKYDRVVVAIAARDVYGFSKLYKLKIILICVSFFSIFLVYFSGLFFIGRALNPVSTLIKQVDSISISNINNRLDEGNQKDDLAKIAITFNKMLDRLESSINMQRIFIANASHELRTPLTIITGQLEIALIKDRNDDEYVRIIKSVLEDIVNVNQLANKLLMIAQASSSLSGVEFSKVRIDDIIWQVRQETRKMNPNYSLKVTFGDDCIDEDDFLVMGNDTLLKTAFNNLIENACKYSDDHSVSIYIGHPDGKIQISFTDNGLGIADEELSMIFEPFYRGKNTSGVKGHGIGLALVKNIINLHKGEISVRSRLHAGSEFKVIIPGIG